MSPNNPSNRGSLDPEKQGEGERVVESSLPDYLDDSHSAAKEHAFWFSNPRNIRVLFYCFLGLLILIPVPTAYRALKNWRAEALLAKSGAAFAVGDSQNGISFLRQAWLLAPGNASVQHAADLHNARAGDKPSLEKLLARMRSGHSDTEEILGISELSLASGSFQGAHEALGYLPKSLSKKQSLRLALTESGLAAGEGNITGASDLCMTKAASMGGEESAQLRTQGALYLLAAKDPEKTKRALQILFDVMNGKTGASLMAWRILARSAETPPEDLQGSLSTQEITNLVKTLPSLNGAVLPDRLLSADLEMKVDPKQKDQIIDRLIARYKRGDPSELLDFARWLNSKGYHQQVISLAGPDRPRSDTDWLLVVLDAQSAQGRWNDLAGSLDSPAGAGIPDAVRHLFLARMAMMSTNQSLADTEWRNVASSLHLEKPETLAYVAGYEERIGATDRAARTYREMADRKETKTPGLIGLIRSQQRTASAGTLIPMYEELLVAAPDFKDAEVDLTYLNLLAAKDIPNSSSRAEKLYEEDPNTLSKISAAALARLRLGNPKDALQLYAGKTIDWSSAPDPWKVVRVAVLRQCGEEQAAGELARSISSGSLRPEETDLLNLKAVPSKKK